MTADLLVPGVDDLDPQTVADLTRLIRRAVRDHGHPLPSLLDPAWRATAPSVRAGVIAAAALLHAVDSTPTAIRRRLLEQDLLTAARYRATSGDLSAAQDWAAAAARPSRQELERLRTYQQQPRPAA